MAHTIVIFGASGDLTSRKLIPALYELYRKKRLPEDTRIVGLLAHQVQHDAWREKLAETTAQFVGKNFDAAAVAAVRPVDLLPCRATSATADDFAALGRLPGGAGRRASGHADLLPGHRAAVLRAGDRQLGAAGLADEDRAARGGSSSKSPSAPIWPRARRTQRGPRGLRRAPGLSHRPLPGQGDGAEHAGAAVRQQHLRADLEPQLHRPRADHRGRGPDGRPPRGLLRLGRRAARHVPEPPAATDDASRPWRPPRASRPTPSATRR